MHYDEAYDIVFSTLSYDTPDIARNFKKAKKIAYFIQDYEPLFVPRGSMSIALNNTYDYGFEGISIGRWLAKKIKDEHKMNMHYFPFCADQKIYHKIDVAKEDAVCFIFQPGKSRRAYDLGIKALYILKKLRPNTKIYLYGSSDKISYDFVTKNMNIISQEECNELYNRCEVGLCLSTSNPSRIPFEMMASGLPVVDLYLDNNIYDLPEGGVLLSYPDAYNIAINLIKVLDDKNLQKSMGDFGIKYMKKYPMNIERESILNFVDDLNSNIQSNEIIKPIYKTKPLVEKEDKYRDCNIDIIENTIYITDVYENDEKHHLKIQKLRDKLIINYKFKKDCTKFRISLPILNWKEMTSIDLSNFEVINGFPFATSYLFLDDAELDIKRVFSENETLEIEITYKDISKETLITNISELCKSYDKLEKEHCELIDKFNQVINSKSWKITSFLRK